MTAPEPLHAPDWYRVAKLRPRIRPGVKVSRQVIRGAAWYVFSDPASGRHHRFNLPAYRLIAACDGQRTVDAIWNACVHADAERAPSQRQAIAIVSQAFEANLIVADATADAEAIVKRADRARRRRTAGALNPLAFRVPLVDPDQFVARLAPRLGWMFSKSTIALCSLIGLIGVLLWVIFAAELSTYALANLPTTRMLVALWIVYPCIKLVHELAHALAVKTYGGDVHEMGLTLLFLTPVPYVDASASTAFADKWRRAAVAAAGIVVELLIAAAALVLWLAAEGGWLKDLAFAAALIGGISTLLVNGNPLLRFDGYYVLCDLLELPNLAARSARYWRDGAKRHLLGARHIRRMSLAHGERPWLVLYAPLAWVYRCALLALLVLLVAQWNASAALVVAALGAVLLLVLPALRVLAYVIDARELSGQRVRAVTLGLLCVGAAGGAVFAVPLPQVTHAPGIVWLPDEALVRAGVEGFIDRLEVREGERVALAAPIAQLVNDQLPVELARVESMLRQRDVERAARYETEPVRVAMITDEIGRLRAERQALGERSDALTVRAERAGIAALDRPQDAPGRFVEQGTVIGHVLTPGKPLVRVLVRNEDVALVRGQAGEITVRLSSAMSEPYPAHIEREIPQAARELPSAALGEPGGGSIATDASDPSGKTAGEARFHFDLRLTEAVDAPIGARALVTFHHGEATLAAQLAALARRTFLRHFER